MQEIFEIRADYKDVLDVEIILGNTCNYKCHYCFKGSNEGDILWPTKKFDILVNNFKKLLSTYEERLGKKRIYLKPIGGEATLWPLFPKFLEELKKDHDVFVRISTNASRTLRYWKENFLFFDEIDISVHNEYANLDHIITVSNFIYQTKKVNLYVGMLMDPMNWKKCVEAYEYLLNHSQEWHLFCVPVTFDGQASYSQEQNLYMKNYTKRRSIQPLNPFSDIRRPIFLDTQLNSIDTDQFKIILNKQNKFKEYTCNIGIDRIFIDRFGNIKGACNQDIFQNGINIYDPELDKKIADHKFLPVICKQQFCSCSSEILLSKKMLNT